MDVTTALLEQLNAKLDRVLAQNGQVLAQNHEVIRQVQRLTTPVDVLTTEEAARRAGVSTRTLERLAAMEIFTDGRPPEKRRTNSPRRFYADEAMVYRSEGREGVRRLRETFGRT
jgi:hypothetical protein